MDHPHPPKEAVSAAAAPTTNVNSSISGPAVTQDKVRRVSCTKCFDAIWYSATLHFTRCNNTIDMGNLTIASGSGMHSFDCLSLKTKKSSEVQEILDVREKSRPHI